MCMWSCFIEIERTNLWNEGNNGILWTLWVFRLYCFMELFFIFFSKCLVGYFLLKFPLFPSNDNCDDSVRPEIIHPSGGFGPKGWGRGLSTSPSPKHYTCLCRVTPIAVMTNRLIYRTQLESGEREVLRSQRLDGFRKSPETLTQRDF